MARDGKSWCPRFESGSRHSPELSYEVMEIAAEAGLRLAIFTAEPGSRSDEALNLLASWAATPEHEPATPARDDVRRD